MGQGAKPHPAKLLTIAVFKSARSSTIHEVGNGEMARMVLFRELSSADTIYLTHSAIFHLDDSQIKDI